MSGLLGTRVWFGGVALVAAFAMAACGDDDGDNAAAMAGKSGGGAGGEAGSPSGGQAGVGTSGSSSAGAGGMNTGDAGLSGNAAGAGGEAGAPPSAGGEGGAMTLAERVRAEFAGMSPLPDVPADTTNAYADNAAAATLGQRFFFDEKFSGALAINSDLGTAGDLQKVSCKSCHDQAALDDVRSNPATVSIGTGLHTRNSPPLVNSSYYEWTNWGGRFSAQWELPLAVVENGVIMNGNRLALAHRIFDVYKTDYEAVFGALTPEIGSDAARFPAAGKPKPTNGEDGVWEKMATGDRVIINRVLANFSKALAAYTRKLVSLEAPFDELMAGDDNAMSVSAQRGALVFSDKGCKSCHGGATFSDQGFHDLGIPQTGQDNIPALDDGRFKDTPGLLASLFNRDGDYSDDKNTSKLQTIPTVLPNDWKGTFRTPSLREVALTAPYMHSGQFATLPAVIDFYAAGGNADTAASELAPFSITDQEKADLIAFLGTLTGKPVAASLLQDTAAP